MKYILISIIFFIKLSFIDYSKSLASCPTTKTWNSVSSVSSNELNGVTYGNNKFVVVGGGGTILTSSDGITWTSRTSGTSNTLNSVAYGLNKFVVVGHSGTALSSSDGTNWNTINNIGGHGEDIIFANNVFMVVGRDNFASVSNDANTWSTYSTINSTSRNRVAYGNGVWLHTKSIRKSTDNGQTWSSINGAPSAYGIVYGNGIFVGVSGEGINVSEDNGSTWSSRWAYMFGQQGTYLYDIEYCPDGLFVLVGVYGTIMSSTDAKRWTINNSKVGNTLYGIAYGNNKFVAVGELGRITILE